MPASAEDRARDFARVFRAFLAEAFPEVVVLRMDVELGHLPMEPDTPTESASIRDYSGGD